MYVNILIEHGAKAVSNSYIYSVEESLRDKIKIGVRVKVKFGNMYLEGFVIEILYNTDYDKTKIKNILEVVDDTPVLNKEMLSLGKYMSDTLLCSLVSAYQVMLPKALKAEINSDIKIKYNKYLKRIKSIEEIDEYIKTCKYEGQIELLCKLKEKDILITRLTSSINTIVKKGLATVEEEEVKRYNYTGTKSYKKVTLTDRQKSVADTVISSFNSSKTFLLYGVTGSGKTEVYMDIIEEALKQGKEAIMLVPEISLTPQIVGKFISRFGDIISVLHSRLSDSERYDEYRKITEGKAKIVIGTRSAIFVPFTHIGVIIIDEEHTASYKQENHPRYNAKDIAMWRSNYHKCPIVLGSATPSMEAMARAGNKVYELLTLPTRVGKSVLPDIITVDMKKEIKKGNFILSDILKNKIKEKLDRNEQIILLLNKRGYSSVITCRDCGSTIKCPNCDITYTYHKTSNNLKCHYCGKSVPVMDKCPSCGSDNIKDYGLGTEKLEEELHKLYNARIVRMDIDTTSKKGRHEEIIEAFGSHNYDILIGTQMIAKGLDFPLVTLVGVINADTSLNVPDFRASENTYALLSQVSGRAGRSDYPGEVIIQTFNGDHYSITLSTRNDYISFYKEEMKIRKMLKYPPYYYLILVSIKTKDYSMGFNEAGKIGKYLKDKLESTTTVLGPTTASMFKVNNIYHYQIIIKYQKDNNLYKTLKTIDNIYMDNTKVKVEFDFNPLKL